MNVSRFLRFNAYLQQFNASVHHECEVTDCYGEEWTRFVLDRSNYDFDGLKKFLKKKFRSAVQFSTAQYKYAPELVYNTVILRNE